MRMRSNNEESDRIDITDVRSGVDVRPAMVAHVETNPRALACGGLVVVPSHELVRALLYRLERS